MGISDHVKLKTQTILVVDDEESIRTLLSTFFKRRGYTVSTAATAAEAGKLIDSVPIDLVILDIVLEDADGLEFLTSVKAGHPNLPVMMLTGIGYDEELLQEALRCGACGYVSKTLPLEQLQMEVHRVLRPHPPTPPAAQT